MIGTEKNAFKLELKKNRFTALDELDAIDAPNKNMTKIIQQSATSETKEETE